MEIDNIIKEIYTNHGIPTKEEIRKILAEDFHMLNESNDDIFIEGILSGIKSLANKIAGMISKLSKKLGGAIVKQIKKFGSLVLKFNNKNWDGYADPETGIFLTGLYSPTGKLNFTSDMGNKNPVIFIQNPAKIKNKSVSESFILRLTKEVLLNEIVADDAPFIPRTGREIQTPRQAGHDAAYNYAVGAVSHEIHQADKLAGEDPYVPKHASPEIMIDELFGAILPRFLERVEAKTDNEGVVPSFMLIGPPGIAKTYAINQCKSVGFNVTTLELAGEQDYTINGIPYIDPVTHELVQAAPKQWPKTGSKANHIIFLDEYNRAKEAVYQVIMNFVANGKLSQYQVPVKTGIILACNAGDRIIDDENVKDITETIYQRMHSTYIIPGSDREVEAIRTAKALGNYRPPTEEELGAKYGKDRLLSAMGRAWRPVKDKDGNVVKDENGNDKLELIKGSPIRETKKVDWVKTLGAKRGGTSGARLQEGEVATFMNPWDDVVYSFEMGGQVAPIVSNWSMHRIAGETGTYEKTDYYNNKVKTQWEIDDANSDKKNSTTGQDFKIAIKRPVTGTKNLGDRSEQTILGSTSRELIKLSNMMKANALDDFMQLFLYGSKLDGRLKVKKPIDYWLDNWKTMGYFSAPHMLYSVNQEFYLQASANAVATKTQRDQDTFVDDMLYFYAKEKESSRFFDKDSAFVAFSEFTPEALNIIKGIKTDLTMKTDGDPNLEARKEVAINRLAGVRASFGKDIVETLNRFESTNDFVKFARVTINGLKNKPDINSMVDIDAVEDELSGLSFDTPEKKELSICRFVATNIDMILDILDVQVNSIVHILPQLKTPFAKKIGDSLTDSSKIIRAKKSKTETANVKKGHDADFDEYPDIEDEKPKKPSPKKPIPEDNQLKNLTSFFESIIIE